MLKATVGIPLFNERNYVCETLRSLKEQPSSDFVACLSDNCSSDDTVALALELIGDDDRFVLVKHPCNFGAAFNFQYLLKLAKTPYFMWLGGHDFVSPNAVASLIESLDRNPSASMAMAMPQSVDQAGHDERVLNGAIYQFSGDPLERFMSSVRTLHDCTICYAMFRTEYAAAYRFTPVWGGDLPFISMLLWHGQLIYDDRCAYYRRMFDDAHLAGQMERIVGSGEAAASMAKTARLYLETFADLYDGDPTASLTIQREIMTILISRFGSTCADGWPHGEWVADEIEPSTPMLETKPPLQFFRSLTAKWRSK